MKCSKWIKMVFLAVLVIMWVGCSKDWLDENPDKSLVVPNTLKDFDALLNDVDNLNSYSPLALAEISAGDVYINEASWTNFLSDVQRNTYTWTKDRPNVNVREWDNSYGNILIANIVIEGLEKIKREDVNHNDFDRLMGESLFLRGRMLYELSQVFMAPYDSSKADFLLGLPVKVRSDISDPTVRTTMQQTYLQMIEDLIGASSLLESIPKVRTRASKHAAFALLSKIFFSMRDYTQALLYADMCLDISSELLDYNLINTDAGFIGNYETNPEVIYHSITVGQTIITSTRGLVDETLYNSYLDNDLRKVVFFRKVGSTIRFKGNYNNIGNAFLFLGLATDDIYLIRAECNARKGNIDLALNDYNNLLRNRWKKVNGASTYIDEIDMDADIVLNKILVERRKELVFRGQRWTDLRRLNQEGFNSIISRSVGGKVYTLEPNSYRYTIPIPDDVIGYSKIQQNPGWE